MKTKSLLTRARRVRELRWGRPLLDRKQRRRGTGHQSDTACYNLADPDGIGGGACRADRDAHLRQVAGWS
jgi:hypothetical protein